jgi:TetR/AcrR family transcriptional repressor of nem operon
MIKCIIMIILQLPDGRDLWPNGNTSSPSGALLMRYDKGHRETTRQHILQVASAQFRQNGIAAVGLAGIMSAAGLTNGAFYTHFESKEDLVREVLMEALDRREQRHKANIENNVGLAVTIREYLSTPHRDGAKSGCPTAALVAEIARHPKKTRETFTSKVTDIIPLMQQQMRHGSPAERRRNAIVIYATMVGALQLSRAVNDKQLSEEILESALDASLRLAGER